MAFDNVEEIIDADSPKVVKPVLSPQAQKLKKATRGWNIDDLPESVSPPKNQEPSIEEIPTIQEEKPASVADIKPAPAVAEQKKSGKDDFWGNDEDDYDPFGKDFDEFEGAVIQSEHPSQNSSQLLGSQKAIPAH